MKNTFLLLNYVISILDLFKILTYYIDNKKILEIRNKNINFAGKAKRYYIGLLGKIGRKKRDRRKM